jgi:hypothetical protein
METSHVPLELRELLALPDAGPVAEYSLGKSVVLNHEPEHPVARFLEDARDRKLRKSAGVSDESWDAPMSKSATPSTGTLAKALGIVRTEIKEIDGDRWSHGYNAAGELVGARLLHGE